MTISKKNIKKLSLSEAREYAKKLQMSHEKLRQSEEMKKKALIIQAYKYELKQRANFVALTKEYLGVLGLENSDKLALKKLQKIADFIKLFNSEFSKHAL